MSDEQNLAAVMTHILLGVERCGALLAQATELHGELVELHAEITNAAVTLEEILKPADSEPAAGA